MKNLLEAGISLIDQYGLLGIAASMIIENLGIPFPTEGAFLVAQRLIDTNQHSLVTLYIWMVATQTLGAILGYGIGQALRGWLLVNATPESKLRIAKEKIETWYDKYGSTTIFATRVIGYIRPWASLVAGMANYPLLLFIFWTALGNMLFVGITMFATSVLVQVWYHYPHLQSMIVIIMVLLFSGLLIISLIKHLLRKQSSN